MNSRREFRSFDELDLIVGQIQALKVVQRLNSLHHCNLVGVKCKVLHTHQRLQPLHLFDVVLRLTIAYVVQKQYHHLRKNLEVLDAICVSLSVTDVHELQVDRLDAQDQFDSA